MVVLAPASHQRRMHPVVACFATREKSVIRKSAATEVREDVVVAESFVSRDVATEAFEVHEVLGRGVEEPRSVRVWTENGRELKASRTDFVWIRHARIAEDVHSCNVVLERWKSDKLRLKVVKDIEEGCEMLLWFSEEIQAMMTIPFLRLGNIQDENRYICHHCQKVYERPNPLKIHLATKCGSDLILSLWIRLQESFYNNIDYSSLRPTPPTLHLLPSYSGSFISTPTIATSAFHPVLNPFAMASAATAGTTRPSSIAAATHLETIVSNMGTSKDGHVCIYCGKVYSRKYGLKIHIRTHTGFKPLKCKFCFRPFGDPSNLNKHIRLHVQGSSSYKCTFCNKLLVRRRDLQRHIQARHSLSQSDMTFSSESE